MEISDIEILDLDKLEVKHHVEGHEVVEVFDSDPRIFFDESGDIPGEDVYTALGRTLEGRYLAIFFIYEKNHVSLVLSARDMTAKEKKRYGKK